MKEKHRKQIKKKTNETRFISVIKFFNCHRMPFYSGMVRDEGGGGEILNAK